MGRVRRHVVFKLIAYLAVVSVIPLTIFAGTVYVVLRESVLDLASQYSGLLVDGQRDYVQSRIVEQVENLAAHIVRNDRIAATLERVNARGGGEQGGYEELAAQSEFAYVVVNDRLEDAVDELVRIVQAQLAAEDPRAANLDPRNQPEDPT